MFESKNVSNTNGFVKSERVVKTSSSIGNLKSKFSPKTVRVAENGTEVVRNIDIIDDRPTSLTTSLANSKSRFENNNEPTTQTITKEVPSWEGKDTAKSKMNS